MDGAMATGTGICDGPEEYPEGPNDPVPQSTVHSMPKLLCLSGMRGGL